MEEAKHQPSSEELFHQEQVRELSVEEFETRVLVGKFDYPLVHAVASVSDAVAVGPSGAWEGAGRMYLLPWATEERPLVSDRCLEALTVVGRAQAAVLMDGGRRWWGRLRC